MNDKRRCAKLIGVLMLCAALVSGCATGRTVLVSDDSPMRVGPDCSGRVYFMESGEWKLSPDAVDLPEGWYLVPPRFVAPEN
ncbi:unnamed protein product [marine sediment metagenome]|uniref:Lipoprotein n=1 Tax=marine sediment metagenome TaxID=412755 RepID=X0SRX9_9ZZZZ